MDVTFSVCETAWGWVGVAVRGKAVIRTHLPAAISDTTRLCFRACFPGAQEGTNALLAALQGKLQWYFRGEDVSFRDAALDTRGYTEFDTRVWDIVRAIPRGQTRSYGWVAQQAGSPRGARAVGLAMATNPFPILVPCHRVVGKHGELTGFGGGLEMKSRLLAMEGVLLPTK